MDDAALEVQPASWTLPNRQGFSEWVHKTFHLDRYPPHHKKDAAAIRLFPHQRLIRDFMQFDSPFRGVVLYHGLGVGKTCASIAAAEGFLAHRHKIVVMLPASLATNYKQEIMRCASIGNPSTKLWNYVEVAVAADKDVALSDDFLAKKKNKVWYPAVPSGARVLRGRVSWNTMDEKEREEVVETLMHIIDQKYTFINFNGLTTKAVEKMNAGFFNESFVIMDEAHNFMSRVMNGSRIARALYERMMEARNIRIVLLSGTPVINHPYELSVLLNLVRGPMHVFEYKLPKNVATISEKDVRDMLGDSAKYVDHLAINIDEHTLDFYLAPLGFVLTDEKTLEKQAWGKSESAVLDDIQKLLVAKLKLTSKQPAKKAMYALPDRKTSFNEWFLDETDPDNPKVKHMDLFVRRVMGVVSYFRTAGEEYFPRVTVRKQEQVPLSDYQFSVYTKVRDTERAMEERKKKMARFAKAGPAGVFSNQGTVYRAFSRMACNFVFPEEIKRKYPMELRKELRKEMDLTEMEGETPAVDDDDDDKTEDAVKKDDKRLVKAYEEDLRRVMQDVQARAAEILSKKALQTTYSPKMAKALEHIEDSPGKTLLYSQFRAVEGLGIMRLVLEQAGYVEVRLEKKGKKWSIHDAEGVFQSKYDHKRFATFDTDREKTKMLLHIYNGEFHMIPRELQDQLQQAGVKENVRGTALRVFMITQSGAEGISLKNVRKVLILEPFWNMVRIDQVIGRAVRTASHQELPPEERTVEVYILTSVFTEQQLKSAFTIKRKDNGLTSDADIMRIAETKNQIIQTFLDHVKTAAIDCRTHAATNKLTSQGIKCYAFPIPVRADQETYVPSLEKDALRTSRLVRKKKIQGKVISMHGKKYVIVDEYPNKLFDYHAYKDAGVLSEALIL